MEKFTAQCRLILLTESISKLIPALRSRCLGIRIEAPSEEMIKSVIVKACDKENFEMSEKQVERIAKRKYTLFLKNTCSNTV